MKKKILLDIDGVIGNFYKSFAMYLNKHYGCKLDINTEVPVYDLYKWGHGLSEDTVNSAIDAWMLDDGFLNIPVYPGAKQFVYKLMDKYDVYIVTARMGDFKTRLADDVLVKIKKDTLKWFKKHGIPAPKIFFDHNKIDFCLSNSISILIEDKFKTAKLGIQNGIDCVLMSRPWNVTEYLSAKLTSKEKVYLHVAKDFNNILEILGDIDGSKA